MNAVLFLFALKRKDDENSPYSHLMLGFSLSDIAKRLNDDISFLLSQCDSSDEVAVGEVDTIIDYLKDCSVWSLGSIDFLTGDLIPCKERFKDVVDLCEVIANV